MSTPAPPGSRPARDAEIWIKYVRGARVVQLCDEYGLSDARIYEILAEQRAKQPQFDRDAEIARQVESLRDARQRTAEIIDMPLPPAFDRGVMLIDENNNPVRDVTGRLAALKVYLGAEAQTAQLLGLNAPTRQEVTVSAGETEASAALAAQSLAFLAGGEDDDDGAA